MAREGNTFQSEPVKTKSGIKSHMMIVVAVKAGECLLVPVTTWYENAGWQDSSCILNNGEHEFIKHKSWIDFRKAVSKTEIEVLAGIMRGLFISMEDLKPDVLEKVQEKTKESDFLPYKYRCFFE